MRVLHWWGRFLSSNFDRALSFFKQRRSAVPLIVQICIAVATLALVVTAFAVVAALSQIKKTAAQVEHTLEKVDTAIPTFIATAEDARLAIDTIQRIGNHVERLGSNVEEVGGKAAKLSNLVLNQVLAPVTKVAAIFTGVKAGTTYLVNGIRKHPRALTPYQGGNHHE
jgi:predicted PurR-regulated permease PerM